MSAVRARETFHHEGGIVFAGTVLSADDPAALEFAPLFESVEESDAIDPTPVPATTTGNTPSDAATPLSAPTGPSVGTTESTPMTGVSQGGELLWPSL